MSLFELLSIGGSYNDRRGLRLPVLLGRLHLGLVFSGVKSGGRRSSDKCTLRSFLFIATVLITRCGSSPFPNRTGKQLEENNNSAPTSDTTASINQLDCDQQDFPMEHLIITHKSHSRGNSIEYHNKQRSIRHEPYDDTEDNMKTLSYFLKGLILPMLISLTLSFGFVIWKKRMKRERMQQIHNALEEARSNPQTTSPSAVLSPYSHHLQGGLVSNALLSVLDARSQFNLIASGEGFGDDYMGEGGETARHKAFTHDQPPDYASVFDPPSYEEATQQYSLFHSPLNPSHPQEDDSSNDCLARLLPCNSTNADFDEDGDSGGEGKLLMGSMTCTTDD